MGVEYRIKFKIKDEKNLREFLDNLSKSYTDEVTISLTADGFYFCDNCSNAPIVGTIFYRLVKHACIEGDAVLIENL